MYLTFTKNSVFHNFLFLIDHTNSDRGQKPEGMSGHHHLAGALHCSTEGA